MKTLVHFAIILAVVLPIETTQSESPSPISWQANADVVRKHSERRPEFNYRETEVPEFELPTVIQPAGSDATEWMSVGRPRLIQQFRNHVYGNRADEKYEVSVATSKTIPDAFDGTAEGRQLEMTISIANRQFSFPFVIFTPTNTPGPTPAVILINNRQRVSVDEAARGSDSFWPVRELLRRGYATASFYTSDVDPDDRDGYSDGIRSFFSDGRPSSETSWGSLSAWGWAASRIREQLSREPNVDAKKVAVVGHSRGGKTALWAAAEDQQFAIAYSNESGCGGAAISRRQFGETVARITSSFPHWFCRKFADYGDRVNKLPVDQHQLIAAIAPRGVYVASADEDLWADPRGEYLSVVQASPAFKLIGLASIRQTTMPPLNEPRVVGMTGYHIRSGKHNLTEVDWNHFLAFANQVFAR